MGLGDVHYLLNVYGTYKIFTFDQLYITRVKTASGEGYNPMARKHHSEMSLWCTGGKTTALVNITTKSGVPKGGSDTNLGDELTKFVPKKSRWGLRLIPRL